VEFGAWRPRAAATGTQSHGSHASMMVFCFAIKIALFAKPLQLFAIINFFYHLNPKP